MQLKLPVSLLSTVGGVHQSGFEAVRRVFLCFLFNQSPLPQDLKETGHAINEVLAMLLVAATVNGCEGFTTEGWNSFGSTLSGR